MTAAPFDSGFHKQVHGSAGRLMWVGIAFIVVGVLALVYPAVSTLAATFFVGWLLVISGILALVGAFSIHGTGPFFGALLFALLSIAAGVFMLARPQYGELAITLALGFLFMLEGAFETFLAFEIRPARAWGWMLASGLASIFLAVVIILGLPGVSVISLGIIIGVNLITSGIGYFFVSSALRRAT
jgi:uncharacterized membrane protein HdeD (DUF308 family)